MGGGLGEILMYETAHPEPVTLPRNIQLLNVTVV